MEKQVVSFLIVTSIADYTLVSSLFSGLN